MPRRAERWLARRGGGVELLRVPALAFGLAAGLRRGLYDRGWLPQEHLDVPVVSVGNLSAGGTGKTPCVRWLAEACLARGRRPGIVSRGYAAPADGPNEETRMLARALPDVLAIESVDRAAGGRALVERGADLVLLDDGFQHRRLQRELDVVLIDATRPWGLPAPRPGAAPVCALLPRGLLREPPRALARADALVVTRCDRRSGARATRPRRWSRRTASARRPRRSPAARSSS
jgi:tetraacyldisaccharide 4'-kinase